MAEFEIPLLSDSGHQVVSSSFGRSDIIELSDECKRDFSEDGPEAVIKYYPLLHGVIRRFDELEVHVREEYWNLTLRAIESLCHKLGSCDIHQLSTDEKKEFRTTTKMLCFIAVRLVDLYEKESPSHHQPAAKQRKPASSDSRPLVGLPSGGKKKIVSLMNQLAELELCQLWEPPSPQMMEGWSSLLGNLCYKILENSTISRDQSLRDQVIHLLGVLIRDYGQALSVSVKVVQLLQHFEHLAMPLAQALATFSTQFNCKNVCTEVVRELGGKDPRDLANDSSGTRSFASFLVELCHLSPDCVLLCVSVLLPHLNGESYTFRNGVLGVMVELLLHIHKSSLDDQARQLRDSLFTKLEEHIHDTNAFVRVKVLQLMMQLVSSQAVPLPRVHVEIGLIAGRLRDKSSSVRKNALQLISSWLTHNPFSGKLDRDEFEKKLSNEQCRLRQLVGEGEEALEERGESEALKQAALVSYFTDALQFITAVQDCVPIATQLLGSKVMSDVLEALEFLCVAEQFGLRQASDGLRKAVVLVWSKDDNIKKALINTYVKIYFTFESEVNPRQRTARVVENLLLLTQRSSAEELASLHQLVGVLVGAGHIPTQVSKAVLEVCTGSDSGRARLASQVMAMLSAAQPSLVTTNLEVLIESAFAHSNPDLVKARYVCQAVQNLSSRAKGRERGRNHLPFERLPSSHSMFSLLHSLLTSQLSNLETREWCPLVEQALATAYKLSNQPDLFAENLLKDLVKQVVSTADEDGNVNSLVLSRLLFSAGQVAFLQMVHCEVAVAMEIKNKRSAANPPEKGSARKSVGGDEGLELTGATADESDAELIKKVLEIEVGGAGGLLATFEPLIVGVVSNPSKYVCPVLQTAACLALAKYMLISPTHCERYVQLFFTVMEKSSLEKLRANAVIAASDMACRFPNLLEPWTPYIYSRLTDHAPLVRRNALTVLTHLILNDMVKVRGQISLMAQCLEDPDTKIADLAKLFFYELSRKGNALYNILPDIISHLSDPTAATSSTKQDSFQNIVRYLFGFIQKDRLCESLVEKLCHRFRAARCVEQYHNLSFCLTLLPVTERSLRKLQENLPCYQDKLVDPQVYSSFTAILNKLKKFSKPEIKSGVEEFEQRLHQIHTKGLGDEQSHDHEGTASQHSQEALSSGNGDPERASAETKQDFTSDVLTSARKQLVNATPTTPLSLSGEKRTIHKSRRARQRVISDSSDSEVENQPPPAKLDLNPSSDSDTH